MPSRTRRAGRAAASLLAIAEQRPDPGAFIRRVAKGRIDDSDLMRITGQYRYDEDIPSSAILCVYYIKPWWDDIFAGVAVAVLWFSSRPKPANKLQVT